MALAMNIPDSPAKPDLFGHGYKPSSGQQDFHFYLSAGAPMIARWQSPSFWLTIVPTTSESSLAVKYALLAMSASSQILTSTSAGQIQSNSDRGDDYYGQACAMLSLKPQARPEAPLAKVTLEEALNASMVLWSCDRLFGRQLQSLIHANAAVKLFRSLRMEDDQTYDTTRVPEPATGTWSRDSRRSLIQVTETFFRDVNFPFENLEFLRMLERRARCLNVNGTGIAARPEATPHKTGTYKSSTDITTIDDPIWQERVPPHHSINPFTELANPVCIHSFFWLIVVADSAQALHVIHEALDSCILQYIHRPRPWSRHQEMFHNQVRLFQVFCDMYLTLLDIRCQACQPQGETKHKNPSQCHHSDSEKTALNDSRISGMLDLIQSIIQMMPIKDNSHDDFASTTSTPSTTSSRPSGDNSPSGQSQNHQTRRADNDRTEGTARITDYLCFFGLLGQHAHDTRIRFRAFAMVTKYGMLNSRLDLIS